MAVSTREYSAVRCASRCAISSASCAVAAAFASSLPPPSSSVGADRLMPPGGAGSIGRSQTMVAILRRRRDACKETPNSKQPKYMYKSP